MKSGPIAAAVASLAFLAAAAPAEAQQNRRVRIAPEIGIRAGRDFSADSWTAGGHIRFPLVGTLELRPSADLSLEDPGDDYQLNADLSLHGPSDKAYLGGGVGFVNRQFDSGKDSGTGVNLFLGFKPFPRQGSQLYLEGRWTFVDSETIFRIGVGAVFSL